MGSAVALSSDGLTLAVGAYGDTNFTGYTQVFNFAEVAAIGLSVQGRILHYLRIFIKRKKQGEKL